MVARALSPAKVSSVVVAGEGEERTAYVVVPDSQLSLAIGKKGQNARLAAKLTGMRIDVKSETEVGEERRRQEAAPAPVPDGPGDEPAPSGGEAP
jgi:N utilization substance protein A